ncbi:hypothetical protein G3T14_09440 [Methylobacterium sp. BTF04]|uniref:hypothetical protein n=1 Tax=Methylobacterium sp. BTF04 TaxID=2708300 RepID=UPI0013D7A34E|nr:hypothetical protein [Methylobacterium sp. BTF04]NEU12357.1 hypothetical protein [Methylobacterium sp. BTF04]
MLRRLVILAGLVAAAPAAGAPLSSDTAGCGGDAYSSAQVVEGRPARRGPITAMPDTLCADLSAPRGSTQIEIYGLPASGYGGDGIGADGGSAPYGGQPPRRPRRGD